MDQHVQVLMQSPLTTLFWCSWTIILHLCLLHHRCVALLLCGVLYSSAYSLLGYCLFTAYVLPGARGHVFGAFASEAWRVGPRFYGTGETFVFQLRPNKVRI